MSTSASVDNNAEAATTMPVIIDLGKISRKRAKQLKRGEGPFLDEVEPAIAQFKADLTGKASGKEILTVVVLYQKKPRRASLPTLGLLS